MNEVDMKETLDRTRCALARHLGDLMDEIEGDGGRIASRNTLSGIHTALESLCHVAVLNTMPEDATRAVPAKTDKAAEK
jgi:hypothetical protein